MKKNSKWDEEEAIMLLSLYFKLENENFSVGHLEIAELSDFLRNRAEKLSLTINETFRNPTGIFMKLKNLQAVAHSGASGLSNYSNLDNRMYNEYVNNKIKLGNEVGYIKEKYN